MNDMENPEWIFKGRTVYIHLFFTLYETHRAILCWTNDVLNVCYKVSMFAQLYINQSWAYRKIKIKGTIGNLETICKQDVTPLVTQFLLSTQPQPKFPGKSIVAPLCLSQMVFMMIEKIFTNPSPIQCMYIYDDLFIKETSCNADASRKRKIMIGFLLLASRM